MLDAEEINFVQTLKHKVEHKYFKNRIESETGTFRSVVIVLFMRTYHIYLQRAHSPESWIAGFMHPLSGLLRRVRACDCVRDMDFIFSGCIFKRLLCDKFLSFKICCLSGELSLWWTHF